MRGRHKTTGRIVTQMPTEPIRLKRLAIDCDITQGEIADATGLSRSAINSCLNKGYLPSAIPGFREKVETFLAGHARASHWLADQGFDSWSAVWEPAGERLHRKHPKTARPALLPGDPDDITEEVNTVRKFMIPEETLKYFHLFRDPFLSDPRTDKEVFRSADHRYLEYAMADAAANSGLLAVIAEVGAGKTVMRREVIEQLRGDERVRVVYPQIIDRSRITAGSICDAIVMDLSSDRVRMKLEDKSRHVRRLLTERFTQGKRVCLIVEEAHRLTVAALKHLKVFHEIEEGRQKLLSIILLGQPELGILLDEEQYPELRELSRRVQIASIPGLGDNTRDYLALKFRIVGGDIERIITDEAIDRLCARLTALDGNGRRYSQAYPLTVNNYIAKAMILAKEMGEERVTADVVDAI
jgi:type II secretory pathway predicted ATPase ExeA/DNA-binding XRE family transcriptional regulator